MFKTPVIQEVESKLPQNCPICKSPRCCYNNHDRFDCNTFCSCRCFTLYIAHDQRLNNTDYVAHIIINNKIYFYFNISAANNENRVAVFLTNNADPYYTYKLPSLDSIVFNSYNELLDYISNISFLYLKYSKLALLL